MGIIQRIDLQQAEDKISQNYYWDVVSRGLIALLLLLKILQILRPHLLHGRGRNSSVLRKGESLKCELNRYSYRHLDMLRHLIVKSEYDIRAQQSWDPITLNTRPFVDWEAFFRLK